jgi:NhaP-type Na+/H+ or K+/H+ antiporter
MKGLCVRYLLIVAESIQTRKLMNSLLILAIALFAGLLSTKLMKLVKLPNVTGYLIVGLLLGPHLINIIGEKEIASFSFLIEIALGFIAFSIGGEFKIENLKKIGKNVFLITFVQAFLALVFVDISLIVFGLIQGTLQENLPLILVLGAVATATAPAATLMVIRQYKARGKLTDTLLLVVALDDAFGLVLFAISLAIAKVFAIGGVITFTSIALMPLLEIVVSLGIGTVLGLILSLATRFFRSRANRLIWMRNANTIFPKILSAAPILGKVVIPVTHTAEKEANKASIAFILTPVFVDMGNKNNKNPINIITIKLAKICNAGGIFFKFINLSLKKWNRIIY